MSEKSTYWRQFFGELQGDSGLSSHEKIAMSNDRVQVQTYINALEGCGPVAGRVGLDAGCGMGDFTRLLAHLGASMDGFDIVPQTIDELRRTDPSIGWFCSDIHDRANFKPPRQYDFVAAVEILQHVDAISAVETLWSVVRPGGRLVASVPNADCPIIEKVVQRFDGHYRGMRVGDIHEVVESLGGVATTHWRGAYFQADQSIVPYGLTPWRNVGEAGPETPVPNRLHFVVVRADTVA